MNTHTERDRLRAATAQRLVETAFILLREAPDTPLSHEIVADKAGISARTAYRHFPTQNDLVAAVWRHLRDTTGTRWPTREADIIPLLRELFDQFERNSALTRAMLAAAPRTNYAAHGSAEGRDAFQRALAERCATCTPDECAQLVATCVAIYSAPFWQLLRDRGQLSPRAAADAAVHAMRAVLQTLPSPDDDVPIAALTPPNDSPYATPAASPPHAPTTNAHTARRPRRR